MKKKTKKMGGRDDDPILICLANAIDASANRYPFFSSILIYFKT